MNDLKVQMYFEWSDGTPVTYAKWLRGEPTHANNRQEDCVVMKGKVKSCLTIDLILFYLFFYFFLEKQASGGLPSRQIPYKVQGFPYAHVDFGRNF